MYAIYTAPYWWTPQHGQPWVVGHHQPRWHHPAGLQSPRGPAS